MPRKRRKPAGFQTRLLNLGKVMLLLGGLVAVGLSSGYMGMRWAVRGKEVAVPSIVGKPSLAAAELLDGLGLGMDVIGERFDAEIAQGAIISQHPKSSGRIKSQRSVQVIVSLGEKRNAVPNLMGAPLRVARLVVSQAGFELGHVGRISHASVPEDTVIQQFPPAQSEGILSPKIDVLVSSGSSVGYVMPEVTGYSLNRVLLLFEKSGFEVGRIQYSRYPGATRGTVIKQFPEPGYRLEEGTSINLEVAR